MWFGSHVCFYFCRSLLAGEPQIRLVIPGDGVQQWHCLAPITIVVWHLTLCLEGTLIGVTKARRSWTYLAELLLTGDAFLFGEYDWNSTERAQCTLTWGYSRCSKLKNLLQ